MKETFRACSDIRIIPTSNSVSAVTTDVNAFGDETTFDIDQFEDYYDELFGSNNNEIAINDIDLDEDQDEIFTNEIVTMHSVQSQKLRLLKKKLILAKALKGLKKLIMLSSLQEDDDEDDRPRKFRSEDTLYHYYDYDSDGSSTSVPWWARTNSHGRRKKKRRRKKRFSFWYDVMF